MLDRSALILDIFAQRAKTKEGRLQVELAQYQYLLPKLSGMGQEPLPAGRRHRHPRPRRDQAARPTAATSAARIAKLQADLKEVRQVRAVQRERRIKNAVPVVAIVGYTNAGKSTLLNQLTARGHPGQQPAL